MLSGTHWCQKKIRDLFSEMKNYILMIFISPKRIIFFWKLVWYHLLTKNNSNYWIFISMEVIMLIEIKGPHVAIMSLCFLRKKISWNSSRNKMITCVCYSFCSVIYSRLLTNKLTFFSKLVSCCSFFKSK